MAKRCRKNGGDCPCWRECKADAEAAKLVAKALPIPKERPKPATVRAGWARPEHPGGDYVLTAIDGGEWQLCWFSDTNPADALDIVGEDAWPFEEDWACRSDFEALGIHVE